MENDSILIKNATILNPGQDIKKSSVLIENDMITKISDDLVDNDANKVIDAKNKILIPGLINTHTHISMNVLRGIGDDLPLDTWLNDCIWPLEANLTEDICYTGALLACIEMIKTGTTCLNDMYFNMGNVAKAVEDSGMRGLLSYCIIAFDDETLKKEIETTTEFVNKYHNTADGRVTTAISPHAPYTTTPDVLKWVREESNKRGMPIHIHVSETKKEIDDIVELYGMRPFEYLEDLGFLGSDVIAAHSVHLSENEIDIIKKYDVKISHNPASNMKLASGVSPVDTMLKKGITVSLGTDGAASNNNLNMFEDMKIAALLQKVHNYDATALPAQKVFEMATINGAKTLGMEDKIGSIDIGKKADLVLLDTKSNYFTPNVNPLSHIVYSSVGGEVSTTICNGKILMEDKELLYVSEAEVFDMAENAAEELLSKR